MKKNYQEPHVFIAKIANVYLIATSEIDINGTTNRFDGRRQVLDLDEDW